MEADKKGRLKFTVDGSTLLRFKAEIYSKPVDELTEEQKDASAQELYDFINSDDINGPRFAIDSGKYDIQTAMKILAVRYAIFINRYQQYKTVTLASDVMIKQLLQLKKTVQNFQVLI